MKAKRAKTKPRAIDKAILVSEGIRRFDKDIRHMTGRELERNFSAESSGRVVLTLVMKNIIWQVYERINAGLHPPITGNLRSFWYLWVKPVLSHIPVGFDPKTDPYDVMLRMFTRLILDLKLFRYSDFDFTDENWENRRIGTSRPGVLVFSEKRGWIRFLRDLHEELGVSILALGGSPSALTSEYTVRDITSALKDGSPIRLIGIVDYDPAGDIIAHSFQNQLGAAGFLKSKLLTVVRPKYYTQDELKVFRFPLPKKEQTKLSEWMKRTGGINGKPYGLEAESMPREKIKSLIHKWIVGAQKLKK